MAALGLLALGLALAVIPWPQAWVEALFARGLFPITTQLLAPWVGAVPWSVSAVLAGALAVALLGSLLTTAGRRRLWRSLLPWTAAVLILGFTLVWGLAYRRATLAELLGIPTTTPTAAALSYAETRLLAVVRATASSRRPGPADTAAAGHCVARAVKRLTDVSVALPRHVKELPAGTLLRLGFAGVTSPWLLEPMVDAGLPPVARLATATHELTHAAGFAREADTDALAVLAGLGCSDPAVRYALALHAVGLLAAALPQQRRHRLLAELPPRARNDLGAAQLAAQRYRVGWMQRAATAIYGSYLRGRGVNSGMADYGRATLLIIQALSRGAAHADVAGGQSLRRRRGRTRPAPPG